MQSGEPADQGGGGSLVQEGCQDPSSFQILQKVLHKELSSPRFKMHLREFFRSGGWRVLRTRALRDTPGQRIRASRYPWGLDEPGLRLTKSVALTIGP